MRKMGMGMFKTGVPKVGSARAGRNMALTANPPTPAMDLCPRVALPEFQPAPPPETVPKRKKGARKDLGGTLVSLGFGFLIL